jgi:hypothetical protein
MRTMGTMTDERGKEREMGTAEKDEDAEERD